MKKLILIAAPLCLASSALAQLSFTGTTITQNFDSLPASSSATFSLAGWAARTTATSSITSVSAHAGSTSPSGVLASFGTGSALDRALGFHPTNSFTGASGSGLGFIWVRIQNNSGANITDMTIGYTGEQWRNDNSSVQSLNFSYMVNASGYNDSGFTSVSALTFNSPKTGGTATALDGNLAANRTALTNTVTFATAVADGETIWLRWTDLNDSGNDHLMGIDDFSFSATTEVVPEPATMTILAGAAAMAALRRRKK